MKDIRILGVRLETSESTGNLPLNKKKRTIVKQNRSN